MDLEEIIRTGDAEKAYEYALVVPGAPIDVLARVVIGSPNPHTLYWFARDVPGAPVAELAQAVIICKDVLWAYYFARDIPGAPVDQLAQVVINSRNVCWMYEFAKNVPNAPIMDLVPGIGTVLSESLASVTKSFTLAQWKLALDMSCYWRDFPRALGVAAAL